MSKECHYKHKALSKVKYLCRDQKVGVSISDPNDSKFWEDRWVELEANQESILGIIIGFDPHSIAHEESDLFVHRGEQLVAPNKEGAYCLSELPITFRGVLELSNVNR